MVIQNSGHHGPWSILFSCFVNTVGRKKYIIKNLCCIIKLFRWSSIVKMYYVICLHDAWHHDTDVMLFFNMSWQTAFPTKDQVIAPVCLVMSTHCQSNSHSRTLVEHSYADTYAVGSNVLVVHDHKIISMCVVLIRQLIVRMPRQSISLPLIPCVPT